MKKILWIIIIILIIIILLLLWLCFNSSCKNNETPSWRSYIKTSPQYIPADSTQQIIVWRTPKDDATYLNSWLDSIHTHCGEFNITVFCGACDSSLMLLTGSGVRTYIQSVRGSTGGGTACQGTNKCPPTGGGDTIYWCVNYPINLDYSVINDSPYIPKEGSDQIYRTVKRIPYNKPMLVPPAFPDTAVTMAVFDTGIDPDELSSYLYHSTVQSCLDISGLANNGWNFPDKNNNVRDDYKPPHGHGQIVSRLAAEQVNHYNLNSIKILPVKIHNHKGESDLFSVLCGFAYASERGARIINASFGFYSLKPSAGSIDSSALLIKQYIRHYLTSNEILLIAAAGNANTVDGDASVKKLFTDAGLPIPSDLRSLDNINFYPASFASDPELPNVIAVTTVHESENNVAPTQNYSQNVVDIGVNADWVDPGGSDYWFINSAEPMHPIRGSSYAAPIAAGIICSHYDLIRAYTSSRGFNKDNIVEYLLKPEVGVGTPGNVNNKVKKGFFYNHVVN